VDDTALGADQLISKPFTFWRGLQTVLLVAFVVATLFTLWTPDSLIAGSLEAKMAQALQAAELPEDIVPGANLPAADGFDRIGIVAGH
jgi:hypothetical protein